MVVFEKPSLSLLDVCAELGARQAIWPILLCPSLSFSMALVCEQLSSVLLCPLRSLSHLLCETIEGFLLAGQDVLGYDGELTMSNQTRGRLRLLEGTEADGSDVRPGSPDIS